jgi:uncharacterized protein YyaL (SSP411 family)
LIVGKFEEAETRAMLDALKGRFLPNVVVSIRAPEAVGFGVGTIEAKATAYVCVDKMCLPPVNSVEKMLEQLGLSLETVKST